MVDKLYSLLETSSNLKGSFIHPVSKNDIDLIFTGGEPLLKRNQHSISLIVKEMISKNKYPRWVTIETNGTQLLEPAMQFLISDMDKLNFFFSVSPKLFTVSGETNKDAICPIVVNQYNTLSEHGQLKFVVSDEPRVWEELTSVVKQFRDAGVNYPAIVMPVGGTLEGITAVQTNVANLALEHGYYFTTRLQNILWGNGMGV